MADICELCMKLLDHWIDGAPDYDGIVLCACCTEKVEEIQFDGSGKSFKRCVEIIRKQIVSNK